MIKQNTGMAYEYFPQGGELSVQISVADEIANTTIATIPRPTIAPIASNTATPTPSPTSSPQSPSPVSLIIDL